MTISLKTQNTTPLPSSNLKSLVMSALTLLLLASPLAAHAQLRGGTDSTTLQGGTDSTMLQGGTDSTTLQGGTGSTLIEGGTAGTLIHGGTQRDGGPVTILFLVDASLSMKDNLGKGDQKMDAAKRVLQQALMKIPTDVKLALRVFGHFNSPMLDPCSATALLVPPGTNNRRSIVSKMSQIRPTGMTPLTYAISQAAESDLAHLPGKKTIILITDGEDTCGFDPCAYIQTLPARGISLKVDVLGLALHRSERSKLDCIAKSSGGKYYDNDTAAKLVESVSHSVSQALSGTVITPGVPTKSILNIETPPELTPIVPAQSLDEFNKQKAVQDKIEKAEDDAADAKARAEAAKKTTLKTPVSKSKKRIKSTKP
jgi:hypothetical protein